MKILLTHGYFIHEDKKEQAIMRPYVPLGILYISAFLERHGYENRVVDNTFSSFNAFCEILLHERPHIIGIYTNLMTKLNVLRIIRFIKGRKELNHTKIILGGPEVRSHALNFLKYGADFIVVGEGEETMLELTEWVNGKNPAGLNEIDGVLYLDEGGQLQHNKERVRMKALDDLPFPNRIKVNLQSYFDAWKQKHGISSVSISTMRGCPYSCRWCSRAVYGQSYRRRSPRNVADELQWIKDHYQVDSLWFVDDVFTVSHKWLEGFTKEVCERDLVMPYECITRADRMNEAVVRDLKASGCFRVWIGAESGSQRVIDMMDRRVEVQQVREMIRLAKQYDIQAGTFIMVGYPGETEEDIFKTVHHLKAADPDLFTITVAYPIKGTPLYAEVEDRFIDKLPWESSTDREIDFKRTYNRKYYNYAVKMISNEVHFHKALKNPAGNFFRLPALKLKSTAARLGMSLQRFKQI